MASTRIETGGIDDVPVKVKCRGPWAVPPEVMEDLIDGAITQRDFIVYATVCHLSWSDYEFAGWDRVAKLVRVKHDTLIESLARLTERGWLEWEEGEASEPYPYDRLCFVVSKLHIEEAA